MSNLRAFTMPKWGIEMSEGTIAEWMIAEGQAFAKGDLITLIETDKITNDVEAEFDARLARIVIPPQQAVPVGALLGVFSTGDATADEIDAFIASFAPADARMASNLAAAPSKPAPAPAPPASLAPAPVVVPADLSISPAARRRVEAGGVAVGDISGSGRAGRITLQDVDMAGRPPTPPPSGAPVSIAPTTESLANVFASPLAKRLAVLHGLDLTGVTGTGPHGRVRRDDVLELIASPVHFAPERALADPAVADPLDGPFAVERMSSMRRAIARQLTLSKQTIPHFYLRAEVQVDAIQQLRAQARQATGAAPSLNDYLVRAVALALIQHPDVNIQVHGEEIRRFDHANIAIAVETESGLMTPVVRAAETKSVAAISSEIKTLAERARSGRMKAEDIRGGGFSISNLGMFGIAQFDAIINPPQGAILAVGAAVRKPIDAGHALAFASMAALSLSCDHRAIDGAVGARFLSTLKALVEDPARLTS